MGSNVSELVKRGHDQVAELKSSCGAVDVRDVAQLISDLATQLDVQFVRSTNMAVQLANAESKCRELAAESGRYSMSAGQADQRMSESFAVREALGFNRLADDVSPSDLVDKIKSIIAECDAIRSAHPQPLGPVMDASIDAFNAEEMPETGMLNAYFILRDSITVQTPQVDAFLAEVRLQARNEGINYAASRLAAAFNHGFVDKPLAEVYDVVRMILTTKEDLANDPAADGLSGEYAEKSLVEFAAQLRQGAGQ